MLNLWKLLRFLVKSPDRREYSSLWVMIILLAGLASGIGSTVLLALVNSKLNEAAEDAAPPWIFLGLIVALPVMRFISQVLLVRLTQGVSFGLRIRLIQRVLALPLRRLEELGSARLVASLTDDISRISDVLSNVPVILLQVTTVLSCIVYMGWLSWKLLLLVVVAVVLGIVSYQLPTLKAFHHFKVGRESWDHLNQHIKGLTQGAKELKMHRSRRKAFMEELVEPSADSLRHHSLIGGTLFAIANSWGQILFFALIGLILYVMPGVIEIDQETGTGFVLAILYMLAPLDVVLSQAANVSRASVAVDKIHKLGLSLTEAQTDDGNKALPKGDSQWDTFEAAGILHTYYREDKDDTFSLGPMDLRFTPGELIFLVGGNGSGKTTLGKLLIGLYPPEAGELRIDGETVGDDNRDAFRQLFTVVFSDFFLFEQMLGIEGQDLDEQAGQYLSKLHLEHKVKVEEGKLSTTDLSQGQRKRLALLIAYLEDRPIYLFDEWAADQDPLFKKIFYLELLPELRQRGKTVIVISHDDQYYHVAERILALEHGRLIYDGDVAGYQEDIARKLLEPVEA